MDLVTLAHEYIAKVKVASSGGFTAKEVISLLSEFVRLAVRLATTLTNPGADKKALVMQYAEMIFDAIPMGGLFAIPILGPYLKKYLKEIVMALVSDMIEDIYQKLKLQEAV